MQRKGKVIFIILLLIILSSTITFSSDFNSKLKVYDNYFLKVKTGENSIIFDVSRNFSGNSLLEIRIGFYDEIRDKYGVVFYLFEIDYYSYKEIDYDTIISIFTSENFTVTNLVLIPISEAFNQYLLDQGYLVEESKSQTIISKHDYYFRYNSKGLLIEYTQKVGDSYISMSKALTPITFSTLFTLIPLLTLVGFSLIVFLRSRKEEKVFSISRWKFEEKRNIPILILSAIVFLIFTIENKSFSNLTFLGKLGAHNIYRGGSFYAGYLVFSSTIKYEIPFSSNFFYFVFLAILSFFILKQKNDNKYKTKFVWTLLGSFSALISFLLFYVFYFKGEMFINISIVFETITNVSIISYLVTSNNQRVSEQRNRTRHTNKKILFSILGFSILSGITSLLLVLLSQFLRLEIRPLTIVLEGVHFTGRFFSILVTILFFLYLVRLIDNEKERKENTFNQVISRPLFYIVLMIIVTTSILSYVFNLNLNWRESDHLYNSQYIMSFIYLSCYTLIYLILFSLITNDIFRKILSAIKEKRKKITLKSRYDNYSKKTIPLISGLAIACLFFIFKNDQLVRIAFERNYDFYDAGYWFRVETWSANIPLSEGTTYIFYFWLLIFIGLLLISSLKENKKKSIRDSTKFFVYTLTTLLFTNYVLTGFVYMREVGWNRNNFLWFAFAILIIDIIIMSFLILIIIKIWKRRSQYYIFQENKILLISLISSLLLTILLDFVGLGINTIAIINSMEQLASRLFKTGVAMTPLISFLVLWGVLYTMNKQMKTEENTKTKKYIRILSIVMLVLFIIAKIVNVILIFDVTAFNLDQTYIISYTTNLIIDFCRFLFIVTLFIISYVFLKQHFLREIINKKNEATTNLS